MSCITVNFYTFFLLLKFNDKIFDTQWANSISQKKILIVAVRKKRKIW